MSFKIATVPDTKGGRWAVVAIALKNKTAHFVLPDGTTACAVFAADVPVLGQITGPWAELPPEVMHLCGYCRKVKAERCECGRCSAERASKEASARRKGLA